MNKTIPKFAEIFAQTFLLGLALLASCTCSSQALEKDGMPCVKELCLGDGLQELQKLNWEPARRFPEGFSPADGISIASRRASNSDLAEMLKNFKGPAAAIRAASAYLPIDYRTGHFDAAVLPLLAQIEAACIPYALKGRYTPAGGLPTVVSIALFASADAASQSWRVYEIQRYFPKNLTVDQVAQVNGQVEGSYKQWIDGKRHVYIIKARPPFAGSEVSFSLSSTGMGDSLSLYRDQSMRHPLCGGTQKFQIN